MQDDLLLDRTLESSIPFDIRMEAGVSTDAFQLRIHSSNCPHDGEGVFRSPLSLVEATLGAAQPIRSAFSRGSKAPFFPVGQILFVPPGEAVRCQFTRGVRRTVSCLFDVNSLSLFDQAEWDWGRIDARKAFDIRNPYIQMALSRLRQEATSPGFASDVHIECALLFLTAELRRHFELGESPAESDRRKLDRHQIALIREQVEDGEGGLPGVQALALTLGMSGQSLSIKFRETTGQTLREYMSEAKLIRARRLLMDGRTMMKQVAHLSGFGSPATFAVAFRKETGMTPSEFRARSRAH